MCTLFKYILSSLFFMSNHFHFFNLLQIAQKERRREKGERERGRVERGRKQNLPLRLFEIVLTVGHPMCCLFSRPSVLAEIFPFSYILFSQLQFSIFLTPSFYTTQPMPHNRIFTSIHPCMDLFLCSPNTYLKLLKVKTMSYPCPDSASDSAKVPKWWSENIWLIHSFILFFPLPIFFHWEWKLHRDLPHPFSLFSLSPPFQLTSLLFGVTTYTDVL